MSFNNLNAKEKRIIEEKGTESPFTGEYDNFYSPGVFICRKCNTSLFSSQSKFDAGCGWPSFDEFYPQAVTQLPDHDGFRTEIECANCHAHLGHVFIGENLTKKNTRHCVNSISIHFIPEGEEIPKQLT